METARDASQINDRAAQGAPDTRGQSVFALLARRANVEPCTPAVVTEEVTITYEELVHRVATCAGLLVERGLVPGEVTGISLTHEIDHLMCAMALLCLGTPQVSLASHEPPASKRAIGQKLGVAQIITRRAEAWMDGTRVVAPADSDEAGRNGNASAAVADSLAEPIPPDAILAYRTTSGSTNVPKAFGLSLENFLRSAERLSRNPAERRVLRTGSMEFDSSRGYRMSALLGGKTCVFIRRLHAETLGELCRQAEVTQIHIGTYKLASLLRAWRGQSRLPAFTDVLAGGSRVPGKLRRSVAELLTDNLWVQYATSEIGYISVASPAEHEEFPEGLGLPISGVVVEIVDEQGNPVGDGEIGQARIRKPAMVKSYVDDPAASAAFRDGWFYPKDLLSRSGNGPLVFHGRLDDMMVLNSINVFPSAIEDVLESHPDVREAIAYAIRSRVHGQIPVAAVVLKDGTVGDTASRLLDYCRQILGIRAPRQMFIVDKIPRNSVGKPLRREFAAHHG